MMRDYSYYEVKYSNESNFAEEICEAFLKTEKYQTIHHTEEYIKRKEEIQRKQK